MENPQNQNIDQKNFSQLPQEKQKNQIPSWLGFVIIIAFALFTFGGVFGIQYFLIKNADININPSVGVDNKKLQNETAGWKTYRNDEYGFEFKYPPSFGNPELGERNYLYLTFKTTQKPKIRFLQRFTVEDIRNNLEEVNKCMKNQMGGVCPPLWSDTGSWQRMKSALGEANGRVECILGSRCEYCEIANQENMNIYVEHNCFNPGGAYDGQYFYNNGAIFSFLPFGNINLLNREYGTDQQTILSTFRFTSPSATVGWKTYSNEEYGFELKYSPDWNIVNTRGSLVSFRGDPTKYGCISSIALSSKTADGLSKDIKDRATLQGNYLESEKDIYVDGVKGKEYRYGEYEAGLGGIAILVPHEGNTYIFGSCEELVSEDLFYQMFSTFKFTE